MFHEQYCHFYDAEEFSRIKELYGSMRILQTQGGERTR